MSWHIAFANCMVWTVNVRSVQFSRSVVSNSLWPHESQHARPPCPSPTPGVHSDSHPSSQWCHPAISPSVVPFSSCPQSLPASGSFPVSQLFAWSGQSTGVSDLASFLPKNTRLCKFLEQKVCSDYGRKYVDLTLFFHLCLDGYLIHLRVLHNKFKGSLRLNLFQVTEQCCSVANSCPTLRDPISTPGFPVLHCLLEFAQTHLLRLIESVIPMISYGFIKL